MRVISGGQTGVDRAAWDAARMLGLPIGGWVPRGRRAEDGVVPAEYGPLTETPTDDYDGRTERNVIEADATLVLFRGELVGGTRRTVELAEQHGRPLLTVDLARLDPAAAARAVRQWLRSTEPEVLNVAGPRASTDPGLHSLARTVLVSAFGPGADELGATR